ncbi:MAG: hypothetical protein UW03_C0019G0003 [Candidatus Peregrinibacteria bacterium GW2011_GWA2_43_8]|nr:MAG: hypothetical protein UW03_C0019G0003 [Candidatus Peregrinibacteria bacterium GW2011_GWA2_43_8]
MCVIPNTAKNGNEILFMFSIVLLIRSNYRIVRSLKSIVRSPQCDVDYGLRIDVLCICNFFYV